MKYYVLGIKKATRNEIQDPSDDPMLESADDDESTIEQVYSRDYTIRHAFFSFLLIAFSS